MEHILKRPSSFIVVVLRSLMHKGCVQCGIPIKTYDESVKHWREELEMTEKNTTLAVDKDQLKLPFGQAPPRTVVHKIEHSKGNALWFCSACKRDVDNPRTKKGKLYCPHCGRVGTIKVKEEIE